MYSIVLASVFIPTLDAPDFGRRHGCHGGGMIYSAGCWGGCGGGCWGGCYGCYGGYPIYIGGTCTGLGGGAGMGGGGGQGGGQGGGGQRGGGQGGGGQGGGGQGGGGEGADQGGSDQDSGSPGVRHAIKELKTSIEQLRKEQAQQRVDLLKMIAEELRARGTEQALNEIRRDLEGLKLRIPGAAAPIPLPMPMPEGKSTPVLPNPRTGRIDLRVPSNALLHVNDEKVALASSFVTPDLEPGKSYYYDFDVSFVRAGKAITLVKRVTIRAGDVIRLAAEDMHPPRWTAVTATRRASASAPLPGPLPSARAALAP